MAIKLQHLLLAIRPHTLPASQAPIILGLAITHHIHHSINTPIAILTSLVALLLQIGTNLVNDMYDGKRGIDSSERLGPARVTQQKILTYRQIKIFIFSIFGIAALLVIPLIIHGKGTMVLLTLTCFLAAFSYTGGPLPLSHYALGEILAFIFFGPLAVWGVVYLQTLCNIPSAIYLGIPLGIISAQIMSINNTRDRQTDYQQGKHTLATILPAQWALLIPPLFFFLSLVVPFILRPNITTLIILLAPLPFLSSWKLLFNRKVSTLYNMALADTGKYMFIYAILFSISLIL